MIVSQTVRKDPFKTIQIHPGKLEANLTLIPHRIIAAIGSAMEFQVQMKLSQFIAIHPRFIQNLIN